MRVVRIFTGPDGRAKIERRAVPLDAGERPTSPKFPAASVFFRETPAGHVFGTHNAPQRQFIFVVSGTGEVELSDGTRWRFGPGDVSFVEDIEGEGHVTRTLTGPRGFAYVPMPTEFDITKWPLAE